MLLGSGVQPSVFEDENGNHVPLGDVVCVAFNLSKLTEQEWNSLSPLDMESKIEKTRQNMRLIPLINMKRNYE